MMKIIRKCRLALILTGAVLLSVAGLANADVSIGLTGAMSGPVAFTGQDQYAGFTLAVEQLGGKLGGQKVHLHTEDVETKPELGVQAVDKLVRQKHVDVVVGLGFSNVMMASLSKLDGTPAIATNSGPSPIAGKSCQPNVFSVAWQNDGAPEATGAYVDQQGYKNVYLMAPNYQAGKDMLAGFKRYFDGNVVGENYTRLGQTDYLSEILQVQAKQPDALFTFYPGGMGIMFIRQLKQSGVLGSIPYYSAFTIDANSLRALKTTAVGAITGTMWSPALDNPANKQFVAAFKKKFDRMPSFYAAAAYDAARLLNVAIKKVGDNVSDHEALTQAIKSSGDEFDSVRGPFKFNVNNMPIQNYYIEKITENNGRIERKIIDTALENHKDAYYKQCPMYQGASD